MPEISVIVPVYNVENKIRRCIDSILAQTFTDFELILIDDGSLDSSGEICDEYVYKDRRIRVVHQCNQGSSAARNNGIENTVGKYLAFVDSDDYIHEDYLKKLYDAAIKYHADMVKCNYYTVSENGVLTECKHDYSDDTVFNKLEISKRIYYDIFYNTDTTGYFSPWNKLFRKQIIIDNSIYMDKTMSFGEDMLFVMEYLKYCNTVIFIDGLLYYYEMLPSGLFNKYREGFLDDIMKCYTSLIEQTQPKCIGKLDYIPISKKYWYYINRHINGIIDNEKSINRKIKDIFSDNRVQTLFDRIVVLSDVEATECGIAPNEMKVPRLVANGKLRMAAFVARYQLDDGFWLRKLRRGLHI